MGMNAFLVATVIKIVLVLFVLLTALAYLVWLERKLAARIQTRWGPYRVGPHGLLQPLADLIKFIFKEDPVPDQAQRPIYFLAPFLALVLALMSISVIPFGGTAVVSGYRTWLQITDLNIGMLFILAMTSLGVYGVALAGWSSGSKYALFGGLRSSAQMISYELALSFSVVGPLLVAGTLSLRDIVTSQSGFWLGFIPRWNLWPQFVAFFTYLTAAFAETNRVPFDLPEAEGELVAGFHTEYASLKFAMFFTAEYANMVTVSSIATILFLGGWLRPLPWEWVGYAPMVALLGFAGVLFYVGLVQDRKPSERVVLPLLGTASAALALAFLYPGFQAAAEGVFWFLFKVLFFLFLYIWVRWTLPRFRYDQLMEFGWKFLLPVAVANVLATGLVVAWRAS